MDVVLKLNQREYTGWTTIHISRSIEQLAGSFELGLARDAADRAIKVRPGDACTVACMAPPRPGGHPSAFVPDAALPPASMRASEGGELLITGYVDTVAARFDAARHSLTISGRDRPGDLVDCSAIHRAGQWQDKTLYDIAQDVCGPFGIEVVKEVKVDDVVANASINDSETVLELLERLARQQGLLLTSDAAGRLVITQSGESRAPGALGLDGVGLISGSVDDSWTERYSVYIGKGSHPDDGFFEPDAAASPGVEVADPAIHRYRPLVVLAEDNATLNTLKKRMAFERNVRAGRGRRIVVTVQGWRHGGQLWQPNQLARIKEPRLNIDDELLIVSVTYTLNEGGTRAQLTLADPSAYDILRAPPQDALDSLL